MKKPTIFSNFWDAHPTLMEYFATRKSFCNWMAKHGFGERRPFTVKRIIELRLLTGGRRIQR